MMGNEIDNLAELKELVRKLKALLDDPHPGLMTWCMAYGKTMEQLVKFWQEN